MELITLKNEDKHTVVLSSHLVLVFEKMHCEPTKLMHGADMHIYHIRGYFCGGFIFEIFASQSSQKFPLQYMAISSCAWHIVVNALPCAWHNVVIKPNAYSNDIMPCAGKPVKGPI